MGRRWPGRMRGAIMPCLIFWLPFLSMLSATMFERYHPPLSLRYQVSVLTDIQAQDIVCIEVICLYIANDSTGLIRETEGVPVNIILQAKGLMDMTATCIDPLSIEGKSTYLISLACKPDLAKVSAGPADIKCLFALIDSAVVPQFRIHFLSAFSA